MGWWVSTLRPRVVAMLVIALLPLPPAAAAEGDVRWTPKVASSQLWRGCGGDATSEAAAACRAFDRVSSEIALGPSDEQTSPAPTGSGWRMRDVFGVAITVTLFAVFAFYFLFLPAVDGDS